MPDYTAVFIPSLVITLTASAAITGGDPVEVSGNGTCARVAATGSGHVIGVAAQDAQINARVSVYARGLVHEGRADGPVTAGDQVVASATAGRQVATLAVSGVTENATYSNTETQNNINNSVNAARGVLGVALTTAADNAKVRWMEGV